MFDLDAYLSSYITFCCFLKGLESCETLFNDVGFVSLILRHGKGSLLALEGIGRDWEGFGKPSRVW